MLGKCVCIAANCLILNRDENFLFDSPAKDPFVAPTKSSRIGDINTGRCYRKTYEALVKKKDVDMILPTIIALDKTQVDTYGTSGKANSWFQNISLG